MRDFVKSRTKYIRIKRKAKKAHKIKEGQKLNDYAKNNRKKIGKRSNHFGKIKIIKVKILKWTNCEHFRNMFSGESDQTENQDSHDDENNVNFDEDLDLDISPKELKQGVFHQKNNSSYGLDNICTEAIKPRLILFHRVC